MGPHKSYGEDGYFVIFFNHYWGTIADSLFRYVNQVQVNPSMLSYNTFVVLIPNIDKPKFVSQFRLIYLCNVIYKIVSKVIVSMIKSILNYIISPYQQIFIPSRSIHRNIIVVPEMVFSMSRMKGRKVFITLKLTWKKRMTAYTFAHLSPHLFVICMETLLHIITD